MTVTITCSDDQARTIAAALDLLMRVHLGQWHVILEGLKWDGRYRDLYGCANTLRALAWIYTRMDAGASHSITSRDIDDEARVAADIKGALRHAMWKAQPASERAHHTVDSSPPMKHAENPLPIVTVTVKKARKS
jgi:hypothetical protein